MLRNSEPLIGIYKLTSVDPNMFFFLHLQTFGNLFYIVAVVRIEFVTLLEAVQGLLDLSLLSQYGPLKLKFGNAAL